MKSWLSDAEVADATRRKPAGWHDASPLEWGGMLLRPGRRRHSMATLADVPDDGGIYALATEDGDVVYVGKARNLHQRIVQHYTCARFGKELPFSMFGILVLPEYAIADVEIAHIHALEPERNRLYEPPSWGQHQAMVGALRELWGMTCE